jgi:hypothetical protein
MFFSITLLERGINMHISFAKLGTSSDADFLIHASPQEGVRGLFRNDAMGTFFLRE